MRVLVACFGNLLRGDDGFASAVYRLLKDPPPPTGVELLEVGIGGIHLVHELLDGVDVLVVVDAVDLGRDPGTVVVQRPAVADVAMLTDDERRDHLADMHYAVPERALMLARALQVLPDETWLVGCQVGGEDVLEQRLSPAVAAGVSPAAAEVRRLVTSKGRAWPAPDIDAGSR